MENSQRFSYSYSSNRRREAEEIKNKYMPREVDKLELLRQLDRRVQTAGQIPALTLGVIGCLIFGIGICFGLDVFGTMRLLAIPFGVLGAAVMLAAYPVYRHVAGKVKAELVPEIMRLSDELIGQSHHS